MRALRQSLRASATVLAATFCLAHATQAQTTTQTITYTPPATAGTPAARIDSLERQLVRNSGRTLTLRLSGGDLTGVFYAPLGIFWQMDKASGSLRSAALMTRTRDRLYLDRGGHLLLTDPETHDRNGAATSGTTDHPLAMFHDRLLAQPLAQPIADLPAGSRFERYARQGGGGVVTLPDAGDSKTITARPLWRSLGDHIVITQGDGHTAMLHWKDLDATLAPSGDEG